MWKKKETILLFKRESALSKIIIQIKENGKYILKSGVVLQMYPFVQIRQPNLQAFKLNNELWLTENQIETLNSKISQTVVSKETIINLFRKAKILFKNGTLESSKKLIDLFVQKVIVYKDRIEIKLNILPDDNPRKTAKNDDNLDGFFDFLKHKN